MDQIQLRSYATVRQLEILDAIEEHGSNRAAARALGVNESAVRASLAALHRKVAMNEVKPPMITGAAGPGVTSSSTLYGADGAPKLQWVKTDVKRQAHQDAMAQFVTSLAEEIKGRAPTVPAPVAAMDDLLAVYPIGDPHFGMQADGAETGDGDWDLEIACNAHESAVRHLASITPPAANALLLNLGDALHMNGGSNTTYSGTPVDVDARYGKVLYEAARAFVRCVLTLLEKHQHVTVWCMRGNHDTDSSLALQIALKFYFHNEPRVTVDDGQSLFKYMRFGNVLLGSHHGHGAKAQDLPMIMAADRAKDWGDTEHRVWHIGHIHHKQVLKDYTGCTVESHRTLARQDAWHAGQGYRAKKDMSVVVYHSKFGELQRGRFAVEMVEAADA